ncbi:O-antigen ligase family protein [Desulfobotulus sp. H1]|uniref:O-antigen ligase family protein n=1 Tax=Desulfobotulus pelophilus TaxID=2823377 RepID=A0ABT3N9P8_9BACT|nr:O-antigen ligase family protein [Desulfobotulus pelophilus]MCW7754188.1 O-antigen ligase family protein [Desulfobotulus pelophilus]
MSKPCKKNKRLFMQGFAILSNLTSYCSDLASEMTQKKIAIPVFLGLLTLPLGLQFFFHTGNTADYRITVLSLQLIIISIGIYFFQPLQWKISDELKLLIVSWLAWGWVCAFNSSFYTISLIRQTEWTILLLFTAILSMVFHRQPRMIPWSFMIVSAGFVLLACGIIIYWNIIPDPRNYDWVLMMPHFTNIRHFGYFVTAIVLLSSVGALHIAWGEKSYLPIRISFSLVQILGFSFLFWSGSRGGILAATAGLFWIIMFVQGKIHKWRFFLWTLFFMSLGLLFSSFFAVTNTSLGIMSAFERTGTASSLEHLLSGRTYLWKIAMESTAYPYGSLSFGYGPDAFRMHPDVQHVVQPHNFFFQALSEWGIPGAIFFCSILAWLYTVCWKQGKKISSFNQYNLYLLPCQALWVAYFFLGLIDGVFYHALPLTLLAMSAAVIYAYDKQGNESSQEYAW